jgi:arsenate reductase
MAEGFAKKYWKNEFNIFSAGTKKHEMNSQAIKVMIESGIDISRQFSKTVEELPNIKFDYVITVCAHAHEGCPHFSGGKTIHVGFEDLPSLTKDMISEDEILNVYRRVRDETDFF